MTLSHEQLRRCTLAVDMGTTRTRIYVKQSGLVVDEPSAVAVNTRSGGLMAVGQPAARMAGRTPAHIKLVHPVSQGTVVDIQMAQRMLRAMAGEKLHRAWRRKPLLRGAVCVPHDADPLARRAAEETLKGLGVRRVELVDTLIAAGIGCGLPVGQPEATMIAVCGTGVTQVAVLSLGEIVAAATVPVGGETIDQAVLQHLRNQHELMLPGQAVRELHLEVAAAGPMSPVTEVHGRDVATGRSRTAKVDPREVQAIMQSLLAGLVDAIRDVLHRCPPELVADLADRGIMLAGGSALLPGLDERLRRATAMPVRIAENPAVGAVNGLAAMLKGKVQPLVLDPLAR
ncbi:rod shape-determining protein [Streptomyces gobiensis]|uniref:rod shape-determining protein n=1 Tax=Streptomyces gobiensis TaxID=2875706 RepID=UPI001E5D2250|nr:rod shape-determining protein [Streptomyces gobiensis]UGY92272.1 rod shape-determining protein [Streptomyces gobiensis]